MQILLFIENNKIYKHENLWKHMEHIEYYSNIQTTITRREIYVYQNIWTSKET